jgi:hypothetical protein
MLLLALLGLGIVIWSLFKMGGIADYWIKQGKK